MPHYVIEVLYREETAERYLLTIDASDIGTARTLAAVHIDGEDLRTLATIAQTLPGYVSSEHLPIEHESATLTVESVRAVAT